MFTKFKELFFGKPLDPLRKGIRKHIALVAFLAWIGLGADGLSSACYGPEQAFLALGVHAHLALYLAIATAFTVFLISLAYNQVISLFPNGGGGYKVATTLLGPYAGLVSGAALIIDYILTIAISIASAVDALFSLLPLHYQSYRLPTEAFLLLFLLYLNIRGVKESIKVLMPIFLGFFLTHALIIFAGIFLHDNQLTQVVHSTVSDTRSALHSLGWVVTLALFLRAYSLGAGTYTGIEAVSNNVHMLAEPRVRTGHWTMFYMALSLSFIAGGIIFLYLLWHATPVAGQTLNAVVFSNILAHLPLSHLLLMILLLTEAGILFVGANTGFLGGPAVLANMSTDEWVPKRFGTLSSRLVTQNGILFFGISALLILLWSKGSVAFLVVLYSMNVFLTFSLSILGLVVYWWSHREAAKNWLFKLLFSLIALAICASILIITLVEKFTLGGWITVAITSSAVVICLLIRRHYQKVHQLKKKLDQDLKLLPPASTHVEPPVLDPQKPTGVFLIKGLGGAIHSLLWVHRMFPHHFHNFVFLTQGVVDIGSFGSERRLNLLKKNTDRMLKRLIKFAEQQGYAATSFSTFGTDSVKDVVELSEKVNKQFPNAIYFASRYVYPNENWFTRILHSDFAPIMQKRLYATGIKMLILPLNL
jgi:amino acid transporter